MKKGWELKEFEDCLDKVVYTEKIQRKDFLEDGEFPVISQEQDFINGYWNNSDSVFKIKKPVVIFGDHTQVLKYVDFDFVLSADGVKILQPIDGLKVKYFYYFLNSVNLKSLGYARHYRLLKEIQVPIPSLPEQQRIVSVLDEAFASIADAKANAERNLVNARELFEVVVERIFDNGEDWENKLLGDVSKVTGQLTRDIDSSLPYIGADSIESNSGRLIQKRTVLEQGIRGPICLFSGKKLLYSKIRPYLNKLSITNFKGYCSSDMYPLEFDKSVLYEFAQRYLLSKRFMESIGGFYERAAIPKINREQLFSVSFPVPPLAEQRAIVGRLEALSAETGRLEEIYQSKLNAFEELKKSVLQKAFEGEL